MHGVEVIRGGGELSHTKIIIIFQAKNGFIFKGRMA